MVLSSTEGVSYDWDGVDDSFRLGGGLVPGGYYAAKIERLDLTASFVSLTDWPRS